MSKVSGLLVRGLPSAHDAGLPAPGIAMLHHLVLRSVRSVVWIALVGSLVGVGASTVRLLPWLVAPDVPGTVSLAFFRSLLLAALEVVLLLAVPIGAALEVARWRADGTITALQSLGVGPLRQLSNVAVVALGASALCLLVSTQSALLAESPGRLSNELLQAAARSACRDQRPARVPLVGATWLCCMGQARLAGRIPTDGPARMAWSAKDAEFSPGLQRVELHDARWTLAKPAVSVEARTVVLTGLLPWVVPSSTSAPLRAAATALTALAAALASTWALLRWPSPSRARALCVAVSSTLGFLLLGASTLSSVGWLGLPLLLTLGGVVPIVVARATLSARLPIALTDVRKRKTVRNARAGLFDE